jgi:hypothetical protein
MDNKEKIGSLDRDKINIHENYEVEYWANKLGVTANRLREAAEKVGTSVEAIKTYLNS